MSRFWAGLILLAVSASAQDLRSVTSPNGQIEFRTFLAVPSLGEPDRLAYQVLYMGKPVIDTSFIAFEIREQSPLGEKLGLIAEKPKTGSDYRGLSLEYMQNGTTGRRINLEARAFDSGVAFRYVIPKTSLVEEIFIQNEDTEFRFPGDIETFPSLAPDFGVPAKPPATMKLSEISLDSIIATPFVARERGSIWISISQADESSYPRLYLNHTEGTTLETALPALPNNSKLAIDTATPLLCPWRIVAIGPTRESVADPRSVVPGP
jgi:alpha-glucosidase